METPTFVEAGTRIYAESGQFLEVTDFTAVGMHGRLYQTELWAERAAKRKADWDGRSRFRKWLGLAPKGYVPEGAPVGSVFGPLFGSLLS